MAGTFGDAAWNEDRDSRIKRLITSSPTVNSITGGGIPRGRITQLSGSESSGKTTLCLDVIKNLEDQGLGFLFFDVENAFSPDLARGMGIKTPFEEWVIKEVDAVKIWKSLIGDPKSKSPDGILVPGSPLGDCFLKDKKLALIVMDSVNGLLVPRVQEGTVGKQSPGAVANFLSYYLPMLVPRIQRTEVAFVGIQQVRINIGQLFGNPESTSGGKSWKHYASIMLHVASPLSGAIKNSKDEKIGTRVIAKTDKNKTSQPYLRGEYRVLFGKGLIDLESDLLDIAIRKGVVKQAGAWISYGDYKAQGLEKFSDILKENQDLFNEISGLVADSAFEEKGSKADVLGLNNQDGTDISIAKEASNDS